jgi:hypothetical protein
MNKRSCLVIHKCIPSDPALHTVCQGDCLIQSPAQIYWPKPKSSVTSRGGTEAAAFGCNFAYESGDPRAFGLGVGRCFKPKCVSLVMPAPSHPSISRSRRTCIARDVSITRMVLKIGELRICNIPSKDAVEAYLPPKSQRGRVPTA